MAQKKAMALIVFSTNSQYKAFGVVVKAAL